MREKIVVITAWTWADGVYLPEVALTYTTPGTSVIDITGQPVGEIIPTPPDLLVEVWADSAVIDAVETDPTLVVVPATREAVADGE